MLIAPVLSASLLGGAVLLVTGLKSGMSHKVSLHHKMEEGKMSLQGEPLESDRRQNKGCVQNELIHLFFFFLLLLLLLLLLFQL